MASWVAAWISVGIYAGIQIHNLDNLTATLGQAGHSLQQTGQSLHTLAGVPFIGSQIGAEAARITASGTSIEASAAATRTSIDRLAYLIAIGIALIPSLPALAVYLRLRLGRAREVRAVRRAAQNPEERDALMLYLAGRGLADLSYADLRVLTGHPWKGLDTRLLGPLARAELSHLGLSRRGWAEGSGELERRW